ncbi:MAG: DUF1501 domain-containing protein [Planctomycetaceae bacterium]|nr:DUF1501 domain-containing protein [Planctomycetaceae bacterium]
MFDILGRIKTNPCDRTSRRDFLQVGTLGATGFTLADLLRSRAAADSTRPVQGDTSVVWLWLGGGATHVETFDPKMTAPSEYRSIIGEVQTSLPGVAIGSLFPRMASLAEHMTYVRSFAHENSGHSGGTHYVMTGYNFPPADQGMASIKPSLGSVAARYRGASHAQTGLPTYVRINGTYADGPAWLGAAYNPFDVGGDSRNNMNLRVGLDRVSDRRGLLRGLDRLNRDVDQSGLMKGLGGFEVQAFDMVLGRAKDAFDLDREDPRVRAKYGPQLGDQMLLARRLCEAGAGFVTLHYGGWDMHGQIEAGCKNLCPKVDQAVAAFIDDVAQRGLSKKILLVITGEFGRTPRINGSAGRDHWAPLSTLAFAHGNFRQGQVVGESNSKAEVPKSKPINPQDLMATVFHHLGIDPSLHYLDQAGRPTPMITTGQPIREMLS